MTLEGVLPAVLRDRRALHCHDLTAHISEAGHQRQPIAGHPDAVRQFHHLRLNAATGQVIPDAASLRDGNSARPQGASTTALAFVLALGRLLDKGRHVSIVDSGDAEQMTGDNQRRQAADEIAHREVRNVIVIRRAVAVARVAVVLFGVLVAVAMGRTTAATIVVAAVIVVVSVHGRCRAFGCHQHVRQRLAGNDLSILELREGKARHGRVVLAVDFLEAL